MRGAALSPAAVFGARILLYADALAQGKGRDNQLRLALLAAGADFTVLFPQLVAHEPQEDTVAVDVVEDYAAVEWTVPSPDEWERVQAALSQRRVSVSTPDPDGGWV